MNLYVDGSRKLFWKKLNKKNGGKVESCSRIKNGRLALGENEVRRIWKGHFEDLYDIDITPPWLFNMYIDAGSFGG